MAVKLDQHYLKTVAVPTISAAAVVTGTLTITGTGMTLTSHHQIVLTLDTAGDVVITLASAELGAHSATSIAIDLDAYDGDTLEAISLDLPNVYTIAYNVNPDIVIAA